MRKLWIWFMASAFAASLPHTAFGTDSSERGPVGAQPRNPASTVANPAGSMPRNPVSTIVNPAGSMPRNPASTIVNPAGSMPRNPVSTIVNPAGSMPRNPVSTIANPGVTLPGSSASIVSNPVSTVAGPQGAMPDGPASTVIGPRDTGSGNPGPIADPQDTVLGGDGGRGATANLAVRQRIEARHRADLQQCLALNGPDQSACIGKARDDLAWALSDEGKPSDPRAPADSDSTR